MRPAPPPHKNLPDTETAAKELTSHGRRSEADHANVSMTTGDQNREDVFSSIADLQTPKLLLRVGLWNVITPFQSVRLALVTREMNNYNLAIMGIAEARWREIWKQRLNSGEIVIWSRRQENKHQEGVALIIARSYAKNLLQ